MENCHPEKNPMLIQATHTAQSNPPGHYQSFSTRLGSNLNLCISCSNVALTHKVVFIQQDILRFWLDKGVDGFHVQNVQYLYEDHNLGNETLIPGNTGQVCLTFHKMIENF